MYSRFTSGYGVFVRENIISWKSKKQNLVVWSSVEAEYRTITSLTCELVLYEWNDFFNNYNYDIEQMKMYCDKQVALHITSNRVFHERFKHIGLACNFI